jgi:ACT domain-containing protein
MVNMLHLTVALDRTHKQQHQEAVQKLHLQTDAYLAKFRHTIC